jgi:hypothetical protein
MKKITRRNFAKQAAGAAVAAPLAVNWAAAATGPRPQLERVHEPRSEELKKKAEARREELVKALRAKALPYDLEPAFIFAAKPRERKRK